MKHGEMPIPSLSKAPEEREMNALGQYLLIRTAERKKMKFFDFGKKNKAAENKRISELHREFNEVFLFCLPYKEIGYLQPAVDKVLRDIADKLHRSYKEQERVQSLPPSEQGKLSDYVRLLNSNEQFVKKNKSLFWRAHRLAKEAGFSVKEKYSDYLDSENQDSNFPRRVRIKTYGSVDIKLGEDKSISIKS